MARVLIGTSGWHYDFWRGPFFPEGLPLKEQLPYYNSQFATTELNGVFYRTPTPKAVVSWRIRPGAISFLPGRRPSSSRIGSGFPTIRSTASNCWRTACRCSAGKRDRSCSSYRRTLRSMPTGWLPSANAAKEAPLQPIRHPSWYAPEIGCEKKNISLCISDHHDAPAPWMRTADFVYVRGHGPTVRLMGHYGPRILSEWGRRIRSWKKQGCDVFVYSTTIRKARHRSTPEDCASWWARRAHSGARN